MSGAGQNRLVRRRREQEQLLAERQHLQRRRSTHSLTEAGRGGSSSNLEDVCPSCVRVNVLPAANAVAHFGDERIQQRLYRTVKAQSLVRSNALTRTLMSEGVAMGSQLAASPNTRIDSDNIEWMLRLSLDLALLVRKHCVCTSTITRSAKLNSFRRAASSGLTMGTAADAVDAVAGAAAVGDVAVAALGLAALLLLSVVGVVAVTGAALPSVVAAAAAAAVGVAADESVLAPLPVASSSDLRR